MNPQDGPEIHRFGVSPDDINRACFAYILLIHTVIRTVLEVILFSSPGHRQKHGVHWIRIFLRKFRDPCLTYPLGSTIGGTGRVNAGEYRIELWKTQTRSRSLGVKIGSGT